VPNLVDGIDMFDESQIRRAQNVAFSGATIIKPVEELVGVE
jgi:hypothetical protein